MQRFVWSKMSWNNEASRPKDAPASWSAATCRSQHNTGAARFAGCFERADMSAHSKTEFKLDVQKIWLRSISLVW